MADFIPCLRAVFIDNHSNFQSLLKLGNLCLHHSLLIFRLVVFTVFGKVAVRARKLDFFCNLLTFYGAQFQKLLFNFLLSLSGKLNYLFIFHFICFFGHKIYSLFCTIYSDTVSPLTRDDVSSGFSVCCPSSGMVSAGEFFSI